MDMEHRKINRITIWLTGLALLLTSCVKDDLYNTSHPTLGAVRVTTLWSACSSTAPRPAFYTLRLGPVVQRVQGIQPTFATLFAPQAATLFVYNEPAGFTIQGNTATVNTLPSGFLEPMPDFLFSETAALQILPDDTLKVPVVMQQRVRQLLLYLKLNAGDEQRIAQTDATLTGIASRFDLASGQLLPTEGKTLKPIFGLTARDNRQLVSLVQMLDVVPTEQQCFTLTLTLHSGATQTVSTNLTELLKNFATSSKEPLVLNATLELPQAVGVNATITNWKVVDNGSLDIQ